MQAAGAVWKLLRGKGNAGPELKGLTRDEVLSWLKEEEEWKLDFLWAEADRVRHEHVGDEVHLRGLIELSNYCRRDCHYCGIRAGRRITRYRMTDEEARECVRLAVRLGYGTVVIQAGEDNGLTREHIDQLVRFVKLETPLAVTLSLGERGDDELAAWRAAGADRYLLRHETSDMALFRRIHPDCPGEVSDRIDLLRRLKRMGYETGSGVMVGIPGQSFNSLADDIMLFHELDLEMVGVGPYLAHPDTPLGRMTRCPTGAVEANDDFRMSNARPIDNRQSSIGNGQSQVPATDLMTTKVVALTRLACPDANIPSTTALATVNRENGRELGLTRGANVWMPNLTPVKYRVLYDIYPDKACVGDSAEACQPCLLRRIESLGRCPGKGPGGRRSPSVGRD